MYSEEFMKYLLKYQAEDYREEEQEAKEEIISPYLNFMTAHVSVPINNGSK